MMDALQTALTIAVAWDTLVVQIAVIPYWGKRESLHKEYEQSGQISLARSAIEENKIVPALVDLFENAYEGHEDKRRKLNMGELLAKVDCFPHLKKVESAMGELASLEDVFEEVNEHADRISNRGLVHCLFSLLLAASLSLSVSFGSIQVLWLPTTGVGALWLLSGIMMGRSLFQARRLTTQLISQLAANGGGQTSA